MLPKLRRVLGALGPEHSIAGLAATAAREILGAIGEATHVTVFLSDGASVPRLTPVVMRAREGADGGADFVVSATLVAEAEQRRRPFLVMDAGHDYPTSESVRLGGLRACALVPLFESGRLIGLVQVEDREHACRFGAEHLELLVVVGRHLETALAYARRLRDLTPTGPASAETEPRVERPDPAPGILGTSEPMRATVARVRACAKQGRPVLLRGETGVGKELLARLVHEASPRADGPFVAVNCASIPRDLFESELFGHERGAFSGAGGARSGLFRAADGGTLFLDEVTEIAPQVQSKLLRVLEDGRVRPVGSDRHVPVDVRVVSATNRDSARLIERGELRSDLYYRLAVLEIDVPPLRARGDDVVLLARRFLSAFCAEMGRPDLEMTADAVEALRADPWPGNVRQLRNVVERAAALTPPGRPIDADALDLGRPPGTAASWRAGRVAPEAGWGGGPERLEVAVAALERTMIERALVQDAGNITHAATRLGLSRQGLRSKMKRYGIQRDLAESAPHVQG